MTVNDFFKQIAARLQQILGSPGEGESAARILFEDLAGYDRKYLFINGQRTIEDFMKDKILKAVDLVANGMPVQYAAGQGLFMGLNFILTPDVLIPRFETEGLVDRIIDDSRGCADLDILDIGTGSGCIAISLASALPFAHVRGVDISVAALAIARQNASKLKVKVDFSEMDILSAAIPSVPGYDIIVSNPPYVLDSEKKDMDSRVYDYEPPTALFVPDSDPLKFYRAISLYARKGLRKGGRLYFEINSLFWKEMYELLDKIGFVDIQILRDYKGNYRYAIARND